MTIAILWIQLGVAAAVILGASLFLAKSADVIAIKTGLGRSFVGVVLLATATSLPELGTGISAVTVVGQPDLAVGGAFGSNLFNLLIIGLMDIFWWRRFLLNHVGMSSVVIGTLGIIVISLRRHRGAAARYVVNVRRVAHQPSVHRAGSRVRRRDVLHLPVRAKRGGN